MKKTSMIVLLVTIALLSLSGCRLPASTAPAVTPTTGAGELGFPVDTATPGSVADFGTQTAVALTPVAERTPQVIVNTPTTGTEGEQGGGAATPAGSTDAGGGQQPAQATETVAPAESGGGAAAAAPVQRPPNYTLKKGEWPICIARRYDLDLSAFLSANGMNMNSKPLAGTTLTIPSTGNWTTTYGARTLKTHPADYTVVAGDTANTIACKFGDVTPEAILQANGLTGDVQVGTTIRIP